jgi:hypothetical protein
MIYRLGVDRSIQPAIEGRAHRVYLPVAERIPHTLLPFYEAGAFLASLHMARHERGMFAIEPARRVLQQPVRVFISPDRAIHNVP